MRIGLDLDGVCYNWTQAAGNLLAELAEDLRHKVGTESPTWDYLEETYPEEWPKIWTEPLVKELFTSARPFFGAHSLVQKLTHWHDVTVVTVRPYSVRQISIENFIKDFQVVPSFYFARQIGLKSEVDVDVFIDDHHKADKLVEASGKPVILLDKLYNREVKKCIRVYDYLGVLDAIAALERGEI